MNRRDFLRLLGVTTAAAVLTPTVTLAADPKLRRPELLVTEYALPGTIVSAAITGLVLPAPAGRYCRARIVLPHGSEATFAQLVSVASFNDPATILLDGVRTQGDERSVTIGPIDAAVFSRDFVPVDWPTISRERALDIDYTAFGDRRDEEFFLGLVYWTANESNCPPFPQGIAP
jgi:hypothetical protein